MHGCYMFVALLFFVEFFFSETQWKNAAHARVAWQSRFYLYAYVYIHTRILITILRASFFVAFTEKKEEISMLSSRQWIVGLTLFLRNKYIHMGDNFDLRQHTAKCEPAFIHTKRSWSAHSLRRRGMHKHLQIPQHHAAHTF